MNVLTVIGCVIAACIIIALLIAAWFVIAVLVVIFLAVFALSWAATSVPSWFRRKHRPGCECEPCQNFDFYVRTALAAAEPVPGPGRDDGVPLSSREAWELRGIEEASEQVRQP